MFFLNLVHFPSNAIDQDTASDEATHLKAHSYVDSYGAAHAAAQVDDGRRLVRVQGVDCDGNDASGYVRAIDLQSPRHSSPADEKAWLARIEACGSKAELPMYDESGRKVVGIFTKDLTRDYSDLL